ncbi:MAG: Gfo/Idh/MocA family oxidoreductase [Bacteroidales bacterium]|nr:Gfo/Idh/MocA family oxidoreductase [Bacteroidales bacterium]
MKQINWGIIGCGKVTEIKSGPAFNKVEGSRLVAVMRRDTARARDYARRHGISRWYDKAQDLINDPEVNAIYVATPPSSHAEYAIAAMRAGKPVYVEKPMARTYEECLEMNRVSAETGMPLFVAYYRRRLPGFLKIKEWLETGKIGTPRLVSLRLLLPPRREDLDRHNPPWHVIPEISGAGYFYDLASHQFDILDYFFDPVKKTQSVVTNMAGLYEAEDTVVADFTFDTGVLGQGMWHFAAAPEDKTDTLTIYGSEGSIHFSTFETIPVRLVTGTGTREYHYNNPENIQFNLIKTVVAELQGKGKGLCPSTGISAARTSRVLENIVKSYYVKR